MEKDVAILMADLTGYTAMTDVHGGASAFKIVNKYMELVQESLFGSTQVMQRIGDQVVMISGVPLDLVVTAKKLITIAQEHHFLSIHMGIHYGSILIENGNLFETLMETVRYCSLGQITNALYAVGGQYRRNM